MRTWEMDFMLLASVRVLSFCKFIARFAEPFQLKIVCFFNYFVTQMITLRLLLLRRGLIQRCAAAKVINFISLGGQHQGVFGVPKCTAERLICRFYRFVLNLCAYTNWAQKHIAQATYWHDPFNEGKYREKSSFLADINNEKDFNENYRKRLQSLNQFVMVKFLRDTIVQPMESSWFGFYKPESDTTVLSLIDSLHQR